MSADNGVYIHKFGDGWRVVEGAAIENAFVSAKDMEDYFSDSPVFRTSEDAWKYAQKLYEDYIKNFGIVEYGVQVV